MNQWGIYSETQLNTGAGVQESFDFTSCEKKQGTNSASTLASLLPTQGWPSAELSQVNCTDSSSVLQLLLPTLAKLNAQNRWITLIAPPTDITKKLFAYYGIDTSRILLIHPKNDVDDKMTMNKALKNGTSGLVILWASELNKRFLAQWRKSVKQGSSTGIIVNMSDKNIDSSSIALSFDVQTRKNTVDVDKIKLFGISQSQKNDISFSKIDLEKIVAKQFELHLDDKIIN